jgi:xanthine dehydrogenase YagS FAD-binding subunit
MATTAGNLLQPHTAAPDFFDTNQPCKQARAGQRPALGPRRLQPASTPWSARATPASPRTRATWRVALRVLDATFETTRADGTARVIPIADFHRLPGNTPQVETSLQPGELITSVTLPPPAGGTQLYRKVRDRASYAFAVVSVAAIVQPDGSGRVALGGVAHKPWRVEAAESGDAAGRCAPSMSRVLADAKPTHDNAFKLPLAERTLAAVLARPAGAEP